MKIKDKRAAGEILGRSGLSQRIINLAADIAAGSYKNAIEKAGRIAVLAEAATYDDYWQEKMLAGKLTEELILTGLNAGTISREQLLPEDTPCSTK